MPLSSLEAAIRRVKLITSRIPRQFVFHSSQSDSANPPSEETFRRQDFVGCSFGLMGAGVFFERKLP